MIMSVTQRSEIINWRARGSMQGEDAFHFRLKEEMRSVVVEDRTYHWRTYPSCFVGSEAVSWIAHTQDCSYEKAVEIGLAMQKKGLFDHVHREHPFRNEYLFYRFSVSYEVQGRVGTLSERV